MGNIILTGMPGAGKSTVGSALAAELGMGFIDTDQILTETEGKSPKEIVEKLGTEEFMKIQDRVVLSIQADNHVIATGGSVACSDTAMKHLMKNSIALYLKYDLSDLENRLAAGRKLARKDGQDLASLFAERSYHYEKNSDIIIDCSGKEINEIVQLIVENIKKIDKTQR